MNNCEESDFSDFAVSEKSSFRVRVCLQQYYTDVRSKCFIFVSKWKRVRWLEERLKNLFSIQGSFNLCSKGHLLPSSEPLAILNPDDQIEVIPQESFNDAVDGVLSKDTSNNINSHKLCIDTLDMCNKKIAAINTHESVEVIKRKESEALDKQKDVNINVSKECREIVDALEERLNNQKRMEIDEHAKTVSCGNEDLQEVKQRALALLDKEFSDTLDVSEDRASSRRTRKRVRKRKRPQSEVITQKFTSASDTILASDTSYECIPTPAVTFTATSPVASVNNRIEFPEVLISNNVDSELPSAIYTADIGPLISRNDAIVPRKPRVVHALENF